MKRQTAYKAVYASEMLRFFSDAEENGLPSFIKFADRIGVRYANILDWKRTHEDFAEAYEECRARLCDRLIDGVLSKKYDATFVKAILAGGLSVEGEKENVGENEPFRVTVTVIDGKGNISEETTGVT